MRNSVLLCQIINSLNVVVVDSGQSGSSVRRKRLRLSTKNSREPHEVLWPLTSLILNVKEQQQCTMHCDWLIKSLIIKFRTLK